MTNKQVNELIKTHDDDVSKAFFKKEIEFTLLKSDVSITFKGFYEFYSYIRKQNNGWSKIELDLPPVLEKSKKYFNELEKSLIALLNQKVDFRHFWNNKISSKYLRPGTYQHYNIDIIFTFDAPITSFLIELNKIGKEAFEGGYKYFFDDYSNISFKNKKYFIGVQKAHEFENQDPDKKSNRIRSERSSLSQLRNDYASFISNSDKTFIEKEKEYSDIFDKSFKKFQTWFTKIIEEENKRVEVNKESLEKEQTDNKTRVEELENLYANKLMLSKPAEYWETRAVLLKKEANKWMLFLSLSLTIALIILLSILNIVSDNSFTSIFSNIGRGIKWSVLLISIISFLAFAIKIFSKLSLSSYHLARDAEERKQLVYVYLSLLNENAISDNERVIILQSLFSRSDTGLLKEDSSPTMPSTSILEKVVSSKNKF